nr:helix-turn-helix transcriptional regulator [Roseivirga sp. E12]
MNNSISLECLSKSIGISKFYLNRLFKELTYTTPVEYITSLRLTEAKNLLRESKMSIIEISTCCGFESQSYFSRTFKKAFGITPSAYRALS